MQDKLLSLLFTAGLLLMIPFIWNTLSLEEVKQLDTVITTSIYNSVSAPGVTDLFVLITQFTIGNWPGVLIAAALFIWKKRYKELGIYGATALGLAVFVNILQDQLARQRPFLAIKDVTALTAGVDNDFGFPSGHSALAFFVACYITNVIDMRWQFKLMIYLLAGLVAFSRVYLGVHFFLDTVAGAILGIAVGRLALILKKS